MKMENMPVPILTFKYVKTKVYPDQQALVW